MLIYYHPDFNSIKTQKGFKANFTKGFLPYKTDLGTLGIKCFCDGAEITS